MIGTRRSIYFAALTIVAFAWHLVLVSSIAVAQTTTSGVDSTASNLASGSSSSPLADEPVEVHCGIDGVYRASQWAMFRTLQEDAKIASVETLDGDGVRVRYLQAEANARNVGYAVPGGSYGPLTIRSADQSLYEGRLNGRPIEPTVPWVVVFGDTLGVEEIGKNELLGKEATVAVSVIDDAMKCPDRKLGFSGVDLVIVGSGGMPVLSKLSTEQSHAIVDYVRHGGRLLLHLGADVRALFDVAPWLNELVAITPSDSPIQLDPGAVETFMSSQTRLENLTVLCYLLKAAPRSSVVEP